MNIVEQMEVADDQAMSAFLHLLNDFISDKITRSDFMNRVSGHDEVHLEAQECIVLDSVLYQIKCGL